jgi:hypothetical protein
MIYTEGNNREQRVLFELKRLDWVSSLLTEQARIGPRRREDAAIISNNKLWIGGVGR